MLDDIDVADNNDDKIDNLADVLESALGRNMQLPDTPLLPAEIQEPTNISFEED